MLPMPLRSSVCRSRDQLDVPLFRRGDVLAVPPAAAERLKQRRGVGKTIGLRLHESDQSRLVSVLCGKQSQIIDGTELQLSARDSKALEGGALGRISRLQSVGIGLNRLQRIGDVLKRGDDRTAIRRRRLIEGGDGGAFLMQQGASIEDRLRHVADQCPKGCAGCYK